MSAALKTTTKVNEVELMRRLAGGDLSALGELYDRHAEDVRRFVLRSTGRPDIADDITQDAFVALMDSAKRYDDQYAARSFLIGIAGKLILRRRRRAGLLTRVMSQLRKTSARVDERTPEQAAAADEALERYRRALAKLSDSKRIAVIMADVEGMSGPEIAAALEIPIGTVWTRLHHARAELRHAIGRRDV